MRKKYVALAMGIALSTSLFTGCMNTSTDSQSSTEAVSESRVYGQIESISDDGTITLKLGTMKEKPEKPDENSQSDTDNQTDTNNQSDSSNQPGQRPDGEEFSMLDLTGETMEITVTDDTAISQESMRGPGGNGQQPPNGGPNGQAPDSESSDNQDQQPDMNTSDDQSQNNQNSTEELTINDLSEGDTISVETDDQGNVTEITVMGGHMGQGGPGNNNQNGGPGNQAQGVDSYTAVTEYTEDTETDGQAYESTGTDENAVLVSSGATVTLDNAIVTRESSDSTGGDNSSFYGVGAAVLTTDGTTTINKAQITTDAKGGAGVFAYGDGVVYVNDSEITTSQDTSGGIHVAGGGTLYASNLKVETNGESSAAIRSDRGGGTTTVDGGTYTSNGTGSPAVYTTADITVKNATLTATNSEAVCIEGKNSLTLTDVDLTGTMPENEQNDCTWNVILYQSMSGDSEEGNSTFSMTGGSLTAQNGGMFYTTNTESTFNLENVDIEYADENDFFLKVTGNSNARGWGSAGENGAKCTFTATDQMMEGDIIWDSISTLDFAMNDKSTLTGAILDDESNAGNGGDGYCNLTISEDSTWIVTGDSTLTSLTNHGTIVDANGKTVTIQGTDGTTYVKGNSSYTITVNSYEN
ncbi:MAG: hypothetical protein IJH60_01505 [Eubacterium sp.]|nr:hypothetical protein [Eubacterium sp.]